MAGERSGEKVGEPVLSERDATPGRDCCQERATEGLGDPEEVLRGGGAAQVVEDLPDDRRAVSLDPNFGCAREGRRPLRGGRLRGHAKGERGAGREMGSKDLAERSPRS